MVIAMHATATTQFPLASAEVPSVLPLALPVTCALCCVCALAAKLDACMGELTRFKSSVKALEKDRERLQEQVKSMNETLLATETLKGDAMALLRQRDSDLAFERSKLQKTHVVRCGKGC
jgi:hypothetical protein